MQYHALALAESRMQVDVVAYAGTAPLLALRQHRRVRLHLMAPSRLGRKSGARVVLVKALTVARVFKQFLQLLWLLGLRLPKPDFILIQNPPAIPTLLVALIAAHMRSAKLVIDWHNFGSSMLSLQFKPGNPVLRMARWYEQTLGHYGDGHLCVSESMRTELAEHWGIRNAIVLYDRPAEQFAPTPRAVWENLFQRIGPVLDFPRYREERPALIVYPTSWTADEDFSLLLEAAIECDAKISRHDQCDIQGPFRHLLIVITGEGPLRRHYQAKITALRLEKVHLRTLWLTPEDYPLMLGAADLGLCCHRSSSGFDLPIKIADLMGAGVPVLALNYGPCITEVVQEGTNGLLFGNAEELAGQLFELFQGFPLAARLDVLRDNVRRSRPMRWCEGWKAAAAPIFAVR
jgi:beta-1,4-mannosyltransferase